MPISKRWSIYNRLNVLNEPDNYGAYQLANRNRDILYIGEGHVKTRLLTHFPNASEPVVGTSYYRYELTGSKERCVNRQNALLKEYRDLHGGKNPPFNTKSRN